MREPLSEKQNRVYQYLVQAIGDAVPPTVREICAGARIKSTSTVHAILNALEEKGYIERDARFSRSIRIAGGSAAQVPVLGRVTAGQPILAVEQIEDYIPFPTKNSGSLFALRVVGLSMRDAGILDGDLVVADRDLPARQGDIVIAMIEDEATVKRLEFADGRPYLMPENPDFDPIYAEHIDILGKVIGSMRSY